MKLAVPRKSFLVNVCGRPARPPSAMPVVFALYRTARHSLLVLALAGGLAGGALAHGDAHPAGEGPKGIATGIPAQERLSGTVAEIVIDDRAGVVAHRYRELRQDDGTAFALQGAAASSLATGVRVELAGRRNGRTFDVEAANKLAGAAVAVTGTEDVDEGTLAIAHTDDFAAGTGRFIYELHTDDGRVRRLDLASLPEVLGYGMRLRVSGRMTADGAGLLPARITILAPGPGGIATPRADVREKAVTVNSVLVIMANFNNTVPPTFTATQAQQVMTTNAGSVANYYSEVSYGQQALNVTVTSSWVPMNMAMPATCNNADWQAVGTAANAAAKLASSSWDPAQYAFVVYLFPSIGACGWSGLAYIGAPRRAYINGVNSFVTQVVTHEMGHNFGLLHAASLRCAGAAIGGSCTVSEYGDPFDTMGNQRAMHFNARQKSKLNWIGTGAVATHTAGTATYTLAPLENPGGPLYAIKIPTTSANRTYWVEFRQPIGFDSALASWPNNGAQVRVASPFETLCGGCDSFSDDTELLDMTPGTPSFNDAALIAGETFSDTTYGINISVLSASSGALTVQVSAGGAAAATTTTLAASPNPATFGAAVTFTATVAGAAPTGGVTFLDGGAPIAGCSGVALAGGGNAPAAACTTAALATGAHTITASYGGNGNNLQSTSASLTETVNRATATVGIASSANPALAGATVVLTATVSGVAPSGNVAFTDGGNAIAGCNALAVTGSGNVRTAACSTGSLAAGTHSIVATYAGDAGNTSASSAPLAQGIGSAAASTNVALAANGGVASASTTYGAAFPLAAVNDGDHTGMTWGSGGGWSDVTANAFPDWVQVSFSGQKAIDRVVVYTLADQYGAGIIPADTQTFTLFGLVDFNVQVWNGTAWMTVATVTGNNLVKRTVTFAPVTTDRVRVNVGSALFGYSRVLELEAWTVGTQASGPAATTTTLAVNRNPANTGASVVFVASVSGTAPTGAVAFSDNGVALPACAVLPLAGAGDVRTAVCETTGLGAGSHAIRATYVGDGSNAASASATLNETIASAAAGSVNVALAANGGVATASSTYGPAFPLASANDGDRSGMTWGSGGGWSDATAGSFPDSLQVQFNGPKTVDRIVLYTLADRFGPGIDPVPGQAFSLFGVVDFDVQAWNGSAWVTVASVTGNNLVARTVTFAPTTTDRIRVNVKNALFGYSRIIELEAWTVPSGYRNVALAAAGGVPSASSTYGPAFSLAAINDGDRSGMTWGSGGGWNDATTDAFPDWVQISFGGTRTIDHVVLYTLADQFGPGITPAGAQAFTLFGIVDFNVQAWNGSAWVTLATVTGNTLVKRAVTFPPTATDRIRVNVSNALLSYSRIVELEAWGN